MFLLVKTNGKWHYCTCSMGPLMRNVCFPTFVMFSNLTETNGPPYWSLLNPGLVGEKKTNMRECERYTNVRDEWKSACGITYGVLRNTHAPNHPCAEGESTQSNKKKKWTSHFPQSTRHFELCRLVEKQKPAIKWDGRWNRLQKPLLVQQVM